MGQNDRFESNHEPGLFDASVNCRSFDAGDGADARARGNVPTRCRSNQVAEAEHGGFFQAVADGTYKKYGLDVTIVPGGPNTNNRILLTAGKLALFMSANTLQSFDAVANNVPLVAVAAIFQKDPQVFLTHPETKITKLEELAADAACVQGRRCELLPVAEVRIRFSESKVKPYTFNSQPFIVDKRARCRATSPPSPTPSRRRPASPGVILLADHGFNAYSTLIETRRDRRQEARPGAAFRRCLRDRLVHYLYGDNSAGNAMIKKMNPEMTDELLGWSVAKMKEFGIVDPAIPCATASALRPTRALRASSTRWCGPAWFAAISISARPIRCASSTRASVSICGRRTDARWPGPLCPRRLSMPRALRCACAPLPKSMTAA
jgi:NitT/TauT family transport system substrate-binding protein